ncbi:hypothetical protein J6590_011450 [Homalodisca vitripennis]|nr:hypothetical protein J6590_011450 [Homalodisca vitripennis]
MRVQEIDNTNCDLNGFLIRISQLNCVVWGPTNRVTADAAAPLGGLNSWDRLFALELPYPLDCTGEIHLGIKLTKTSLTSTIDRLSTSHHQICLRQIFHPGVLFQRHGAHQLINHEINVFSESEGSNPSFPFGLTELSEGKEMPRLIGSIRGSKRRVTQLVYSWPTQCLVTITISAGTLGQPPLRLPLALQPFSPARLSKSVGLKPPVNRSLSDGRVGTPDCDSCVRDSSHVCTHIPETRCTKPFMKPQLSFVMDSASVRPITLRSKICSDTPNTLAKLPSHLSLEEKGP